MFKFLSVLSLVFLYGCDNTVLNNSGAIEPIPFTGVVWAGNVRHARVQFVGVDRYGQAQRQANGAFYGDSYFSDDEGKFNAAIEGSYDGSVIGVATYADYDVEISPATEDSPAVMENRKTELRCVLPSGCVNELGVAVDYGDWYPAPVDFEMWGAVSSVDGLETLNITPITHLAAKYAFSQSVSDGINCEPPENGPCLTSDTEYGIFTPETIFKSNNRVKQFFLLDAGLHVNTLPWYAGVQAPNDTEEVLFAKHGLMAMALQKMTPLMSNQVMSTLAWWTDSFLNLDGNLYIESATDAPSDLDVKQLVDEINAVQVDYSAAPANVIGDVSVASLEVASQAFSQQLQSLEDAANLTAETSDKMPFTDVEFASSVTDKILAAQTLVSKVQNWSAGFALNQYDAFFDPEVALEIQDMEADWAIYNQAMGPVMESLLKPIIKTAEYGLSCIKGVCNEAHDLDGVVTFDAEADQVSLVRAVAGSLTLDGEIYQYESISIVGEFSDYSGQGAGSLELAFSEVLITTSVGVVQLSALNGIDPKILFYFDSQDAVDPFQIDFLLQQALISSVSPEVGVISEYQFKADVMDVVMLGTRDAVIDASPMHYNIESINIQGDFSKLGGVGDAMALRFTLNSENAKTYYSPNRFPDLEVNIDSTLFKNYTKLDGDASEFIANQGGWFTLPMNISEAELPENTGQTLPDSVTFQDVGVYSGWGGDYDTLKDLLNISNTASATLGTLVYPGGETALVIYKVNSTDEGEVARQCTRVGNEWGCQAALSVSSLGCGQALGVSTASILSAFNWLKSQACLSQVKIDGRGVYDINYGDLNASFNSGDPFSITLNSPEYLGIKEFYISLVSDFVDSEQEVPTSLLILSGAAPDLENVALGLSLAHDYYGGNSGASIGVDALIPYGKNSIWLAVTESSSDQDVLVYYIQDGSITLSVFGFDYSDLDSNTSPSHDQPLGVIRYGGQLLGTLRYEGNPGSGLYVIRYIDGSWQLL